MNFHDEAIWKLLLQGQNIQFIDDIDWELGKTAYVTAISDLKICTFLKNWRRMKKAVKKLEDIHQNFCSAYSNYTQ